MGNSRTGFVIMQIGNSELDSIYTEIFVPALNKTNLAAKRIDKDNEGQLLKKEIISYIESAEIIIADLTNERPNCYLEIGYAMGLDKYKNLIFTAREDHHPENINYKKGGPKVHFDLSGYDILFWSPDKLDEFKNELVNKINRRLLLIEPKHSVKDKTLWDKDWLAEQNNHVLENLNSLSFNGHIEILISPTNNFLNLSQSQLLEIADNAQINRPGGWPIAIVFNDSSMHRPTPKVDGIISEIKHNDNNYFGKAYDFAYFKKNGQIFITTNLNEDRKFPNVIIPEYRIKVTTEILLYIFKYYTKCNLTTDTPINISIIYHGLKDRSISYGDYTHLPFIRAKLSKENLCKSEITTTLREIEASLPQLVNKLIEPLFVLFDFYKIDINNLNEIVNKFEQETNNTMR